MFCDIFNTTQKFGSILADPPWTFVTRSAAGKDRSAEMHYDCMTIPEIKALPVANLAAKDATLFMWVTDPLIPLGLEVMEAWGFRYKTVGFSWAKLNKEPSKKTKKILKEGWTESSFFTGMGYWSRANSEICLLGTRGAPKRLNKDVRRLLIAPRREHSRKPDQIYDRIERLTGGPYLEMFSRRSHPGWANWGNETEKFDSALVGDLN
jgi:N6-adenosine-specific RNA methylase IME4